MQAFIIKGYPSKLLFTTIQCFLSSIQSLVIALAVERDFEQWKLGWNIRLVAVIYCVILLIFMINLVNAVLSLHILYDSSHWICDMPGNYGDGCDILLTNMGDREKRTCVSSHVNTTGSYHYNFGLCNYLWRDYQFGKV